MREDLQIYIDKVFRRPLEFKGVSKIIVKIFAKVIAPITGKSARYIEHILLYRKEKEIYNIFIINTRVRIVSFLLLIIISSIITSLITVISFNIAYYLFANKRRTMLILDLVRPWVKVNEPNENVKCFESYFTSTRVINRVVAYVLILIKYPLIHLAEVLGFDRAIYSIDFLVRTALSLGFTISTFSRLKKKDKRLLILLRAVLTQLKIKDLDKEAINAVVNDFDELFKNLSITLRSFEKFLLHLDKALGYAQYNKGKRIPLRAFSLGSNTLKTIGYAGSTIANLSGTYKKHLKAINGFKLLYDVLSTFHKTKRGKSVILKTIIGLVCLVIIKIIFRTSSYKILKRKGIGYFILSTTVFVVSELFLECLVHKIVIAGKDHGKESAKK